MISLMNKLCLLSGLVESLLGVTHFLVLKHGLDGVPAVTGTVALVGQSTIHHGITTYTMIIIVSMGTFNDGITGQTFDAIAAQHPHVNLQSRAHAPQGTPGTPHHCSQYVEQLEC